MKVAVISGNTGGYDVAVPWVDQVVPDGQRVVDWRAKTVEPVPVTVDIHRFTDANLPPRPLAMTGRLRAGIPKMFGWQLVPGYDCYIWIDASRGLLRPDTAAWFLAAAGWVPSLSWASTLAPSALMDYTDRSGVVPDLVLFAHPERSTIRAEYEFMKRRMARPGESYLTSRYKDEWLDEQYRVIADDPTYVDDTLYASTAFAYRNTPKVQAVLKEWWYHKSRYLLHDQLALPYVVKKAGVTVRVLTESVYACEHLPMTRVK